MSPALSELIQALPTEIPDDQSAASLSAGDNNALPFKPQEWLRPIPLSGWRRLTALGTLQAKITAAYFFHWLRGKFLSAEAKERDLLETHWRTAIRVLDSMCYLRGAMMKAGQTLANFPDIAPRSFVETLDQLHFQAPPMHWSLLRELVHAEYGAEPEEIFATFDRQAFAAASIGQVHRARLKTGDEVAVKIQYPGIGRAIQADFRNFNLFLLPTRIGKDWENTRAQFDDLRERLEQETDYELEANRQERVRALFHPQDGIVVPRVFRECSTGRILVSERLEGMHLTEYLARNPSQEARNEIGRKIVRTWYRMMYTGRMVYIDFHPGNFLVLNDGRLGVVDFGCLIELDDTEWDWMRRIDRPLTTGLQADRVAIMREWSQVGPDELEFLRLLDLFAEWSWMGRFRGGDFDFGDEADLRRGIDLFCEMLRKRFSRARPGTAVINRGNFALRGLLFQVKSRFNLHQIAEEEIVATGWDRSEYLHLAARQPVE